MIDPLQAWPSDYPRVVVGVAPLVSGHDGVVAIDLRRRRISRGGRDVKLGRQRRGLKFQILVAMILSAGRPVTAREITACVDRGEDRGDWSSFRTMYRFAALDLPAIGLRLEPMRHGMWQVVDVWRRDQVGVPRPAIVGDDRRTAT